MKADRPTSGHVFGQFQNVCDEESLLKFFKDLKSKKYSIEDLHKSGIWILDNNSRSRDHGAVTLKFHVDMISKLKLFS